MASWKGNLQRTESWRTLENTALYSNDLRVRGAAIEINLVMNDFDKTDDTADRLLQLAAADEKYRGWYAWELGMLANRGVATQKIYEALADWIHDKDQQTRRWAVEGMAHIGTDYYVGPATTQWLATPSYRGKIVIDKPRLSFLKVS